MKRLFISLTLSAAICISANAQEAFRHLSAGIELGTTGIGAELALPIVTNHLVIKAGATFPNASSSITSNYDVATFTNRINEYISAGNQYLSKYHSGEPQMVGMSSTTKLEGTGKIYLSTFKAILEYYPAKNSGFHISAGIYTGNERLIGVDATAADLWKEYETNVNISKQYPDMTAIIGNMPELKANIDGKTYQITSPGNVNLELRASKVRPYFGIGFGKSVPETRCGFQFDLGAIYLGKTSFTSDNQVAYQSDVETIDAGTGTINEIMNTLSKFAFYPVVNFRFIVRLF